MEEKLYKIKVLGEDVLDLENEDIVSAAKTITEYIRIWPDVDFESGFAFSFVLAYLHRALIENEIEISDELNDKIHMSLIDRSKDN